MTGTSSWTRWAIASNPASTASHATAVNASAATIHRADAACTRGSDVNSEREGPRIMPPFKHEPPRQTISGYGRRLMPAAASGQRGRLLQQHDQQAEAQIKQRQHEEG